MKFPALLLCLSLLVGCAQSARPVKKRPKRVLDVQPWSLRVYDVSDLVKPPGPIDFPAPGHPPAPGSLDIKEGGGVAGGVLVFDDLEDKPEVTELLLRLERLAAERTDYGLWRQYYSTEYRSGKLYVMAPDDLQASVFKIIQRIALVGTLK